MNFFNSDAANLAQLISLPLEAIGFLMTLMEIYRPMLADKIENKIDLFADISQYFQSIDNFIKYQRQYVSDIGLNKLDEQINKLQERENDIIRAVEEQKNTIQEQKNNIDTIREQVKTLLEQNKKIRDLDDQILAIMDKISFIQFILLPLIMFFIIYIARCITSLILPEETISHNIAIFYAVAIALSVISIVKIAPFTEKLIHKGIYHVHIAIKFLNQLTNGKALGAIGVILAGIGLLGEIYQVLVILLNK